MDWEKIEQYVDNHTAEGRKQAGAWRWVGLWKNRNKLLPFLEEKDVLDIGGASAPIGYGEILDTAEIDIWGRRVKYHDENICKKFDTVFASHILEHYEFPAVHLRRWHGLLKDGGHLILQVPSMYNIMNHPLFNENHHCVFTIDGDVEQGIKSKMLPLRWFLEQVFTIEFLEYVGNTGILAIGRK